MEFEDIFEFSSETSAGKIMVRIMDLLNGQLVLITDSDRFRLGLAAVAIPAGHGRSGPTSTGLFTMGLDVTLVRTLAERIASWTNQTCMLVLGMGALTREHMMEITALLKDHFVS